MKEITMYDLTNEEIIDIIYSPNNDKSRDEFLKFALWCILDLHKNAGPELDEIRSEYDIDESVDFKTEFILAPCPIRSYINSYGDIRFTLDYTMRLTFDDGTVVSLDSGDIGFESWCDVDTETNFSYITSLAKVPYSIDYVSPEPEDSVDRIIDRYYRIKKAKGLGRDFLN